MPKARGSLRHGGGGRQYVLLFEGQSENLAEGKEERERRSGNKVRHQETRNPFLEASEKMQSFSRSLMQRNTALQI